MPESAGARSFGTPDRMSSSTSSSVLLNSPGCPHGKTVWSGQEGLSDPIWVLVIQMGNSLELGLGDVIAQGAGKFNLPYRSRGIAARVRHGARYRGRYDSIRRRQFLFATDVTINGMRRASYHGFH